MSESHVVGKKCYNEWKFLCDIFCEAPVMLGFNCWSNGTNRGILYWVRLDPENYLTYFMKIDNAKFKHKVLPGDTLYI
jgi:UDP-3-O-[3-hydroxymyristoyl] N-acetylglucosamine deacetylase/3-hydroxyacyl-[acyl-carrier-protein] dehydratase